MLASESARSTHHDALSLLHRYGALELVGSAGEEPHLTVLDLDLPGGFAAADHALARRSVSSAVLLYTRLTFAELSDKGGGAMPASVRAALISTAGVPTEDELFTPLLLALLSCPATGIEGGSGTPDGVGGTSSAAASSPPTRGVGAMAAAGLLPHLSS